MWNPRLEVPKPDWTRRRTPAPRARAKVWYLFGLLTLGFASSIDAKTAAQIFEQISPSVVVVRSQSPNANPAFPSGSQGSGVVIGERTVITNAHVVNYSTKITVEHGEDRQEAFVRYVDVVRDLCWLEVPGLTAPSVQKASYKTVKVGETVFALGAPQGLDLTLSQGLVSSIRENDDKVLIQTSAAISKGSSGGGLFNEKGELIGITTLQKATGQNLNFAVPADWIDELPKRSYTKTRAQGALFLKISEAARTEDAEGLKSFSEALLAEDPDNGFALAHYGDAMVKAKEIDQAIEAYGRLTKVQDPIFEAFQVAGYKGLGEALMKLHRYSQAIPVFETYRRQLLADPKPNPQQQIFSIYALEKKAECLLRLQDYDGAIEVHQEVARVFRASPAPFLNVARVERLAGRPAQAHDAIEAALQAFPNHAAVLYEKGVTYLAEGKHQLAADTLSQILKTPPWTFLALPPLCRAMIQAGEAEKAIPFLETAFEKFPGDRDLGVALAEAQVEAKQYQEGVATLSKLLDQEYDPKLQRLLVKAAHSLKDWSLGAEALDTLTFLEPENVKDWYQLGLMHGRSKDFSKAAHALEAATKLRPESTKLWHKLGQVYISGGNSQKAKSVIRRLAKTDKRRALHLKKLYMRAARR